MKCSWYRLGGLLAICLVMSQCAFAQEEEVDEDYFKEVIYGFDFNTNGGMLGGVFLKMTKIIKPRVYRSLGIEIVNIKHPKEFRLTSPATGSSYLFGKRNYLYGIRLQYGRDIILFRKAPQEGIQVSANFAAGPTIGMLVPYYILYPDPRRGTVVSEPYDPRKHTNPLDIQGPGGFLEGLGDANIIPGVNAKVGLSLDFGTFRNNISGIEAGFTFEHYFGRPEILAAPVLGDTIDNPSAFLAAYFKFFFGTRK